MKPVLDQYIGKIIVVASRQIKKGTLALVADDYFCIQDSRTGSNHYFPYTAILDITETKDKSGEMQLMVSLKYSR